MQPNIMKMASEYQKKNIPFSLAMVVRRVKPTSGKQGDKAIILEDGSVKGWIGGGCTRPIVINEAKQAMRHGTPRLIRITPDNQTEQVEGIKYYEMTCFSGGSVDVYIEPVLGKPDLIILGRSAIAKNLAHIAYNSNYNVSMFASGEIPYENEDITVSVDGYDLDNQDITKQTNLIISTQGESDEAAIAKALDTDAGYIGFVVSSKKWSSISSYFKNQGYTEEQLSRIHAPAGLDIIAKTPSEVAISILAEIIQYRNSKLSEESAMEMDENLVDLDKDKYRVDPVCDMTVEIETAEFQSTHNDQKYYFCCAHCKDAFDSNPESYIE